MTSQLVTSSHHDPLLTPEPGVAGQAYQEFFGTSRFAHQSSPQGSSSPSGFYSSAVATSLVTDTSSSVCQLSVSCSALAAVPTISPATPGELGSASAVGAELTHIRRSPATSSSTFQIPDSSVSLFTSASASGLEGGATASVTDQVQHQQHQVQQHQLPPTIDITSPGCQTSLSSLAPCSSQITTTAAGNYSETIPTDCGAMIGSVDGGGGCDGRSGSSGVVVLAQKYSWVEPCGRPTSPPPDFNPRLHGHQVVEVSFVYC